MYHLIESAPDLQKLANYWQASNVDFLAVDLEGESNQFRYGHHLCLAQFFDGKETWIVDVMKVGELSLLQPIMENQNVKKVMYSVDFDVRLWHFVTGYRIRGIFDIQIAARMLGFEKFDLGFLLGHYLNFEFKKNEKLQRSNWNKRPMTSQMLEYAASDVRPLLDLRLAMLVDMREKINMADFEAANKAAEGHSFIPKERPWLGIKGSGMLRREEKRKLKDVFLVRDELARQWDKPPYHVISNPHVLELAKMVNGGGINWDEINYPRQKEHEIKAAFRHLENF